MLLTKYAKLWTVSLMFSCLIKTSFFSEIVPGNHRDDKYLGCFYDPTFVNISVLAGECYRNCSFLGYDIKDNCYCSDKITLRHRTGDKYCFSTKAGPQHYLRVYSRCQKYKFNYPRCSSTCYCRSGFCRYDGTCDTSGCWSGTSLDYMGRCRTRECDFLDGDCKELCYKNREFLYEGCSCSAGKELASHDNECKNKSTCFCPICNPKCNCHSGFSVLSHPLYTTCIPDSGQCEFFKCSSGYCYEDDEGLAHCGCAKKTIALEDTKCAYLPDCANYPLCHNCKIDFNGYIDCSCQPGYELRDNYECHDVDECAYVKHCTQCTNYEGTFYCLCNISCGKYFVCRENNPKPECIDFFYQNPDPLCRGCKEISKAYDVVEAHNSGVIYIGESWKFLLLHIDGNKWRSKKKHDVFWMLATTDWESTYRSRQRFRLDLTVEPFKPAREQYFLKLFVDRKRYAWLSLKIVPDKLEVEIRPPYSQNQNFGRLPKKEVAHNLEANVVFNGKSVRNNLNEWYCTTKTNLSRREITDPKNNNCLRYKIFNPRYELKFWEKDLNYLNHWSFQHFIFYVYVTYKGYKASSRVIFTYKKPSPAIRIICKENCENSKNQNLKHIIKVDCLECDSASYAWTIGNNSAVRFQSSILEMQLNFPPQTIVTLIQIYFKRARRTIPIKYPLTIAASVSYNCKLEPSSGFAFETKFHLYCAPVNYSVKITSGYCHLQPEAGFLRFQGKNLSDVSLRSFSAGNALNSNEKCLFMQTMSNFEDLHKIKFIVKPRYMYVPNFVFLNKNRNSGLASLNDIQNAVEYLNEDDSFERLDISLKAKHRTQIFKFLFESWFENEEIILRSEIVKTLESLVSQPLEIDPFLTTQVIFIKGIVNIYKYWNSSISYLDYKEVKYGYRMIARILAALLHATYLQANMLFTEDYQSKEIIGNITDGLYYYGEAYTDFAKTSNLTIEQTLVFTFASQKIYVKDLLKDLHFEIFTHNGFFMIDIPSDVLMKNNKTNMYKVQLVVFPYNPLELENNTLYIPTVSISIKTEDDEHLDLNDFYHPVKITIPSAALGNWLNYREERTETNKTLRLELPKTYFHNTIYKFNLNLNFSNNTLNEHRIYGFFTVAVCNGTLKDRTDTEDSSLCYELIYRHINFYNQKSINLNFILPPMLTTQNSMLTMQFTSLYRTNISISLNLKQASCQYWYHSEFQKTNVTSYGCSVSSINTDDKNLVCFCYHLSTFSGTVDAIDANTFFEIVAVFYNKSALIGVYTILIIWIFYFLLSIWAIYKDHMKSIMAFPVDLCDNFPSFQIVYLVIVETGVRPNAGCEGSAFIMLYGTLGKSLAHKLKCRHYPALQKGEENFFLIRTRDLLGDLTSIRIWLTDNKNDTNRISWYIDRITVYDLQTKETYEFLCDEWLALNTKNYFSDLTFMAASQVSLNDFKHLFTVNFYTIFEDTHAWFSIFSCPIQSPYTRFQRTISCLLNTHIYLLTTLLLQYYDTSNNKNANLFATGLWEVIMTLIFGFLLVPVFALITFLFSESRASPSYHILSDWNRNTTRMLSTPKKYVFKEEVVDEAGNSFWNRLKIFFKRFNKKKDELFVFFHFTDPELLKDNYLKKHPHMKDILALKDDDDPFDNLRQEEKVRNVNFSNIKHYSDGINQFQYRIINQKKGYLESKKNVTKVKVDFEMGDQNEKDIFDKKDVAETYETIILNLEKTKKIKVENEIKKIKTKQKNNSVNNKNFNASNEENDTNKQVANIDIDDKNDYEDFEPNTDLDEAVEKNVTEALKTEAKKKLKKKKDYEGMLPPWVRYLAWFLLISANIVCAYFIILLTSWDSANITLTWYLKVFATFCGNIFLLDPALIIFYALIGSMVSGTTMVYPYGKLSVIKSEAIIDLKNNYDFHMKRVLKIRQDPHYNHEAYHRQKMKHSKKIKRSQRLFFSIIVNIFLALFSYTLCFTAWDPATYLTYSSIKNIIFPPYFEKIIERDHYYEWVRETLVEEIYPVSITNPDARAMVFSRVHKLADYKHLNGYAITYPCFTRIMNDKDLSLKTWKAYMYGPEWYTRRTYCLGYDKKIALAMVDEMQKTFFFNEKYYGVGMTFYFHIFNTDCIVWVFSTAFQAPGGGLVTQINKISVISKRTIPYHRMRVIISLIMFFPAFAFFVFTSMRTFLYEGAGYYFGSIWNIIDMFTSFLVLILNIIIVVVLPGMEKDLENFFHDTGDLQTLFYISGVDGIYFLMFFIMFLSFIKLIESIKTHGYFSKFITTTLNATKPTILIFFKLFPLFFAVVITKEGLFSRHFLEYSSKMSGTINFIMEMICRRKLIEVSGKDIRWGFVIILQKIFAFFFIGLVAATVMQKYKYEMVMKIRHLEGKLLKKYMLHLFYSFISKIIGFRGNPFAKVRRRM